MKSYLSTQLQTKDYRNENNYVSFTNQQQFDKLSLLQADDMQERDNKYITSIRPYQYQKDIYKFQQQKSSLNRHLISFNQTQQIAFPEHSQQQYLQIQQKFYLCCPQLYESFKSDSLLQQFQYDSIHIKKYQRRNQLIMKDTAQIQIIDTVKLTLWRNGDYKMIYNDMVYFWHQQLKVLDKYCKTI